MIIDHEKITSTQIQGSRSWFDLKKIQRFFGNISKMLEKMRTHKEYRHVPDNVRSHCQIGIVIQNNMKAFSNTMKHHILGLY